MNRNAAFGVGALLGAAAAFVWDRRSRLRPASQGPDTRRSELREKLAEAERPAPPSPPEAASPKPAEPLPPEPSPPPDAEEPSPPPPPAAEEPPPPHAAETEPAPPPLPPGQPPPADEFEAMRRRIHEEGKAAAEEMRRTPDEPS